MNTVVRSLARRSSYANASGGKLKALLAHVWWAAPLDSTARPALSTRLAFTRLQKFNGLSTPPPLLFSSSAARHSNSIFEPLAPSLTPDQPKIPGCLVKKKTGRGKRALFAAQTLARANGRAPPAANQVRPSVRPSVCALRATYSTLTERGFQEKSPSRKTADTTGCRPRRRSPTSSSSSSSAPSLSSE